jgi:hypothetical protein
VRQPAPSAQHLDASASVGRYVAEPGSAEVNAAIYRAGATGTALGHDSVYRSESGGER